VSVISPAPDADEPSGASCCPSSEGAPAAACGVDAPDVLGAGWGDVLVAAASASGVASRAGALAGVPPMSPNAFGTPAAAVCSVD